MTATMGVDPAGWEKLGRGQPGPYLGRGQPGPYLGRALIAS